LGRPLEFAPPRLPVFAPHFVRYPRREARRLGLGWTTGVGTLEARWQSTGPRLLVRRIEHLSTRGAAHGPVLGGDHVTREASAGLGAQALALRARVRQRAQSRGYRRRRAADRDDARRAA